MTTKRTLGDLTSVGPATLDDFDDLGITEVEQLIELDARELFKRLREMKGGKLDRCCEDVFRCAIEQARDPQLPDEQRQWWYWSRRRK